MEIVSQFLSNIQVI